MVISDSLSDTKDSKGQRSGPLSRTSDQSIAIIDGVMQGKEKESNDKFEIDQIHQSETLRGSGTEQQIVCDQSQRTKHRENLDQEVLIDGNEFHDVQRSRTPCSRPGSRQKTKKKTQKPEQEVVEKRPGSRESMSGFTQTEPAEWYQQDDNEDELMIILDTEIIGLDEEEREFNPLGLLGSRPESRERSSSRNSQGSSSNLQANESMSAAPEGQTIPDSISKNIQVLRKMDT